MGALEMATEEIRGSGSIKNVFVEDVGRYDKWFDSRKGRLIFEMELACFRALMAGAARPWLEVGVGTGRFASALGADEGVDASDAALLYAARRGIDVRLGRAEKLPYPSRRFGAVLMAFTLCFLDDPERAFLECGRVLKKDARAVVGLLPRDGPWGRFYSTRGAKGHRFYSRAVFRSPRQVSELAESAGFHPEGGMSGLFESPQGVGESFAPPRQGVFGDAGFVAMRFKRI